MSVSVYKHSGRVGNVLIALLVGAPLVILASVAYAYIVVYNPFLSVLTPLISLGFGALIGTIAGTFGKRAKCRNVLVTQALGVLLGLLGLYASWVFYVYAKAVRYGMPPLPG